MIFNSPPVCVDLLDRYTAAELEAEPMLFKADWGFAAKHAGRITLDFLGALGLHMKTLGIRENEPLVIDTRTHMLMRGHYPCIPGWHHDDVPRGGANNQPQYDAPPYASQHLCAVIDAYDQPTGALPEFAHGPIDVPWPLPEDVTVYAAWDAHINAAYPEAGAPVRSREVWRFDCNTFHRGMPARSTGWRFFIRATWGTNDKPVNKIRRNANVYVPWSTAGW